MLVYEYFELLYCLQRPWERSFQMYGHKKYQALYITPISRGGEIGRRTSTPRQKLYMVHMLGW